MPPSPLKDQTLMFPLFAGRDGGSDSKAVRRNLLESENLIQTKAGAMAKRPGLGSTAAASGLTAANPLVGYDGSLVHVFTTLVDASSGTKRSVIPTISNPVTITTKSLGALPTLNGSFVNAAWGLKANTGSDAALFSPSGTVYFDSESGAVWAIDPEESFSDVKVSGDYYWQGSYAGTTITRDGSGWISDKKANTYWDIESFTYSGSTWDIIGYVETGGNLKISISQDGGAASTFTSAETPGARNFIITHDNATEYVFFVGLASSGHDFDIRRIKFTATLGEDAGAEFTHSDTLETSAECQLAKFPDGVGGLAFAALYRNTYSAGSLEYDALYYCKVDTYATGPGLTPDDEVEVEVPAVSDFISHLFFMGGNPYAAVRLGRYKHKDDFEFDYTNDLNETFTDFPTHSNQDTVVLIDLSPNAALAAGEAPIAAVLFPRAASIQATAALDESGTRIGSGHLSHPFQDSFPSASSEYAILPVAYGPSNPQITWVKVDATDRTGRIPHAVHQGKIIYDVGRIVDPYSGDVAYPISPPQPSLTASNGAGALTNNANYVYRFVPIYNTGMGYVQGRPSSPVGISTGATDDTVTISWSDNVLSVLEPRIVHRVDIYRSQAGGGVMYYVGNATIGGTDYTDTTSDAELARNAKLYSSLYAKFAEHEVPPPFSDLAEHDARLWGIPADDPTRLYFTGRRALLEPGPREGPSWSFYFSESFPYARPRRLASFGGVLLVLCDEGLWGVSGRGPNTANAGAFSQPQRFVGAPGIKDVNSVVVASNLIFYKADKGWYAVDRGFNVSYIGGPVEDYNSNTVLNAVRRSDEKIQILLDDNTTCLVYDPEYRTWDVWTYGKSLDNIIPYEGGICAKSSTVLYQDTGGEFVDLNVSYLMKAKTRWFNLDKFTGYQRLREMALLGEYKSAHTVRIKVYYDYVETAAETVDLALSSDPAPYLLRYIPTRQNCKAVRFDIEEVSPSGTEESATWTGIQLRMAVDDTAQALYTGSETLEVP